MPNRHLFILLLLYVLKGTDDGTIKQFLYQHFWNLEPSLKLVNKVPFESRILLESWCSGKIFTCQFKCDL